MAINVILYWQCALYFIYSKTLHCGMFITCLLWKISIAQLYNSNHHLGGWLFLQWILPKTRTRDFNMFVYTYVPLSNNIKINIRNTSIYNKMPFYIGYISNTKQHKENITNEILCTWSHHSIQGKDMVILLKPFPSFICLHFIMNFPHPPLFPIS